MTEDNKDIEVSVQEAIEPATAGYLHLLPSETNWGLTVDPSRYNRINFTYPSHLKDEIIVRYDTEEKETRKLIIEVDEGVPNLAVEVRLKNHATPVSLYIEPEQKD